MLLSHLVTTGLDGARIDGGWYRDVQAFVRDTPWLHWPMETYATYGVILFAVLLLVAGWSVRRADPGTIAIALWAPVTVVLGYAVNDGVKSVFTEPRPCQAMANVVTLLPCEAPRDWSFPSNHSALAGAAAVAILLVSRKWGIVAVVAALLMAASRVYVGAHYPHDVLIGLLVGGLIGASGLLMRRPLTGLVSRFRPAAVGAPPAPHPE